MMDLVLTALTSQLSRRGLDVAADTVSTRRDVYVRGAGDLAGAVFALRSSAAEAVETLYNGQWSESLPPRFAVLPQEAVDEPEFELLEQMRIHPLIYHVVGSEVEFPELDEAVGLLRADTGK